MMKSQKGFGAIEGLLILVIVVLIGFAGWYVWHSRAPKPASSANTTATMAPSTSKTSTTLKVPELGVQITHLPASISDLTYTMASKTGTLFTNQADFSTKSLTDKNSNCFYGSVGTLFKAVGTYDAQTDQGPFKFVKQFSGFWIAYKASGVPCTQDKATLGLQTSQITEFGKIVTDPANLVAL